MIGTLPRMQNLELENCGNIRTLDGLETLLLLERLQLSGCASLEDISAIAALKYLRFLLLRDCGKLDDEELRGIGNALPGTHIMFPDGSAKPPP